MEDYPDSCFHSECMECFECKKKRERLMREKALKRPFLKDEEEARKMNPRNGTLVIRERNKEDRIPEIYKEDQRPVEEEPEKLISIEEEEEPRRPRKGTLEDIIEVLFDELETRWDLRMQQNGVGLEEKEPQSLNKALVSGINDDEEEEPWTLNEGDMHADFKEMGISNYEIKPSMQIGEEKPRRSNRRRRGLEIEISDDEAFEQMSAEEFKLSDEDKKPKKKVNNNKKKKKKQKAVAPRVEVVEGDDPPPDLPEDFKARIREMNGTDLILVLQKQLFKTDINKGENRISIPINQIRREFLTEEEKVRVVEGMQVLLIQPSLAESTITFKKWKMKKNCYLYVFTKEWKPVVKENSLRAGTLVQIWSFRVGSELRFALVKVPRDGGENIDRGDNDGGENIDGGENGVRDDEL